MRTSENTSSSWKFAAITNAQVTAKNSSFGGCAEPYSASKLQPLRGKWTPRERASERYDVYEGTAWVKCFSAWECLSTASLHPKGWIWPTPMTRATRIGSANG